MAKPVSEKKLHRAWSLYDWANSAYNLVITSTIFPVYYIAVTQTPEKGHVVSFFGRELINSALLNYALAFAYLIIAILSPILSSIADYKGNKKSFMQLFCFLGAAACCGLFFFEGIEQLEVGLILAVLAAIGYCGSLVFYNAYLPEIASTKQQDKLSAQGFSYGYVGSVLLQLICLALLFMLPEGTLAPRLSFLLVGLWWFGFSLITFRYLPNSLPIAGNPKRSIWYNGFHELMQVAAQVRRLKLLRTFLLAFFFYSMGVQTVMLAAAEFGSKEIKKQVNGEWVPMGAQDLIITILLIQLVAIGGALLMARLSQWIGNVKVLMLTVLIWIGICILAYYTYTATGFYVLAVLVGLVMGGIQSLSRSTYSKMMPQTKDTASFFSFYDVTEKVAIVIGMFTFGFMEQITGNMRQSIITLAIFFLIGFLFLLMANKRGSKVVAQHITLSE